MKTNAQITIKLNEMETELNEIKRKKRNDLNFYDFSKYEYYEDKISELEQKIKEITDKEVKQVKVIEQKIDKIYYKDVELSKRDFEIINNKKVYKPLYICIYEKDVLEMLENMDTFYRKRRHEIYVLYKGNKKVLEKDKEFNKVSDEIQIISMIKSWVKFGTYKNFIIKFDKNKRPNRKGYTEILYYLTIDGYIPHIDILEII